MPRTYPRPPGYVPDPSVAGRSDVYAHVTAGDPHPGYLTPTEGDAAYEATGSIATHEAASDPHTGYLTEAAASGTYGRLPAIETLSTPVIVAHRAAGLLAPENTLAGMSFAAALPGVDIVDAGDFRATRDGSIVALHDATLTAKTSLTGNLADHTLGSLRRSNIVDASAWLGGGWPDTTMPTAVEVLNEFGGNFPITVEPKDTASATALAALISARGIGPSVLFNAATTALVAPGVAAGAVGMVFYTSSQVGSTTSAAIISALSAAGVSNVCVQHGSDLTKVGELITGGLKVWVYDVFRHYEYDDYAALNIRGFLCDDPLYTPGDTSIYRKTSTSWGVTGTWSAGHLNTGNSVDLGTRGTFVGSAGAYRWSPSASSYNLVGEISPVANPGGSYTLTVPITMDTLSATMTDWAGFYFAQPTDLSYANAQAATGRDGYNLILRANGDAALYKVVSGTATQVGSTSAMPDLTAGASVTLTVAVTPTGITVTRSDGGASITTTDTTTRGGYCFVGMNGYAGGLRVSFGTITVT